MYTKTLLNSFKGNELADEQLKKLKSVIKNIMDDVFFVSNKYNLNLFIYYGTLLGAYRHKGFIPWDDDIDLLCDVSLFSTLCESIEKEFPGKYRFDGYGGDEFHDPIRGLKISLKNTQLIGLDCAGFKVPRGIGIDVFPLFSIGNKLLSRKRFVRRLSIISHKCVLRFEYDNVSDIQIKNKNKKIRNYYKFRRFLGFLLKIHSTEYYIKKRDKMYLKKYDTDNVWAFGIPVRKNVLKKSDFYPLSSLTFEGCTYPCPHDVHKSLSNIYGDYMKIPDVDKREKHAYLQIDFGDYE